MIDVDGSLWAVLSLSSLILDSKKSGLAKPEEQASKQHFSIVSASVLAAGFLLLISALTSFNKPLSSQIAYAQNILS